MINEDCVALQKRFKNDEITLGELRYECAMLSLTPSCWNELQIILQYPIKPMALIEYEGLSLSQRGKLTDDYRRQFTPYYRECSGVRADNQGRYHWLKEMRGTLKDEPSCVKKIDEVIGKYEMWLQENKLLS